MLPRALSVDLVSPDPEKRYTAGLIMTAIAAAKE